MCCFWKIKFILVESAFSNGVLFVFFFSATADYHKQLSECSLQRETKLTKMHIKAENGILG